ncbi:MAG: serine/threonine-protein kinase, partial [Gemmatimonadota bacterium]|nr:serine/threonine-protein kinase [Gemmatimonadota bacterium]
MPADLVDSLNAALSGRYRIEAKLGEGGMATVYLAADLKHERKVALKVLKPAVALAIGPERFLAEIKTTANLQHPAVLPLHDSGVADGHVFYAMPHVRGASLRDRLADAGRLPLDEVIRITTEIGSGLAYAHSEGVVHRDIKPGNILLSEGHAVLADFGLAKAFLSDGITETGGVGGTVSYMSPEQIQGDAELDARADQYSFACVVYEMLAGERPFTGSSPWEVIARQASGEVRSLSSIRPEAAAVDVALLKALAVDPDDRFATTDEFTREVVERLSGRPGTKIEAPATRSRKRWLVGWGGAA